MEPRSFFPSPPFFLFLTPPSLSSFADPEVDQGAQPGQRAAGPLPKPEPPLRLSCPEPAGPPGTPTPTPRPPGLPHPCVPGVVQSAGSTAPREGGGGAAPAHWAAPPGNANAGRGGGRRLAARRGGVSGGGAVPTGGSRTRRINIDAAAGSTIAGTGGGTPGASGGRRVPVGRGRCGFRAPRGSRAGRGGDICAEGREAEGRDDGEGGRAGRRRLARGPGPQTRTCTRARAPAAPQPRSARAHSLTPRRRLRWARHAPPRLPPRPGARSPGVPHPESEVSAGKRRHGRGIGRTDGRTDGARMRDRVDGEGRRRAPASPATRRMLRRPRRSGAACSPFRGGCGDVGSPVGPCDTRDSPRASPNPGVLAGPASRLPSPPLPRGAGAPHPLAPAFRIQVSPARLARGVSGPRASPWQRVYFAPEHAAPSRRGRAPRPRSPRPAEAGGLPGGRGAGGAREGRGQEAWWASPLPQPPSAQPVCVPPCLPSGGPSHPRLSPPRPGTPRAQLRTLGRAWC